MTPDRPTRRGFLSACSAAAAALGLTARAAPARPPIPDGGSFDGPAHSHYLGPAPPRVWCTQEYDSKTGGFTITYTPLDGGSGYTSKPTVTFSSGPGSRAGLDWKLTKIST